MAVIVSAGICGPVHAQGHCPDPVVALIGEHFGIDNLAFPEIPGEERKPGDVVAATCSAWPENTQQTLAVFAYHDPKLVDEQRVPLIVALVDDRKRRVLAEFRGSILEEVTSVLEPDSFSIGTARYELAPGIHAFSVDASTRSLARCVDGGEGDNRRLFVREGAVIRLVLDNFYLSTWHVKKGTLPGCGEGTETGKEDEAEIETAWYSIGTGSVGAHGFVDLAIDARSSVVGKEPLRYVLQYDGRRYPGSALSTINGGGEALSKWRGAR